MEQADVPNNLQQKIIELQSNNELKARYINLPRFRSHKLYIRPEDFSIRRRHALKFATLFGKTYYCKQIFSKPTLAKTLGSAQNWLTHTWKTSSINIPSIWHRTLELREAIPAIASEVNVIYVFNNLEWPSRDVIKIEMALDRKNVPYPCCKERSLQAEYIKIHANGQKTNIYIAVIIINACNNVQTGDKLKDKMLINGA